MMPRLLFLLTSLVGYALILAVVAAPWLAEVASPPDEWGQLLDLFAQDAVVRRTALLSAVALLVTAVVFFRPAPPADETAPPKRRPDQMAGA